MAVTDYRIVILLASVREGRKSDRVARYFKKLVEQSGAVPDLIDLRECAFPLFSERLKNLTKPGEEVVSFARKIKTCDGIIIVTPEYNGGYPASLKNVVDLLYDEWKRKPIAISTVSSGAFAGSQVITSLLFTLWKIGAWVVPSMCPIPHVEESFSEEGNSTDESIKRRSQAFIKELFFSIRALRGAENEGQ